MPCIVRQNCNVGITDVKVKSRELLTDNDSGCNSNSTDLSVSVVYQLGQPIT
ncbi:MAG: hypothetical protein WBL67_03085 [Nitrososphaeraceae archaeon]